MPDAASGCKRWVRLHVWAIKHPSLVHGNCQEFPVAKRSCRKVCHARPTVFDLAWTIARTGPVSYSSNTFAFICKAWNLLLTKMMSLQKAITCCKGDFWSLNFFESFPPAFVFFEKLELSFSLEFLLFPIPLFLLFRFTPRSPALTMSAQRCPTGGSAAPRHVSPPQGPAAAAQWGSLDEPCQQVLLRCFAIPVTFSLARQGNCWRHQSTLDVTTYCMHTTFLICKVYLPLLQY